MSNEYQKGWDIDLEYGLRGESMVRSVLQDKSKIEVKTDRLAHATGNVAVEYSYKGLPSGIATTESDMWAFVLYKSDLIIFISTKHLKAIARRYYKLGCIGKGGDNNQSEMILIPIEELTKSHNYERGLH